MAGNVWQVTIGDKAVRVEDLPLRAIDRIAKESGESWFAVVNQPCLDLLVADALVGAAAEHLGVAAPVDLTPRRLVDLFELIADDVPDQAESPAPDPLDPATPASETPG